MNNKLVYRPFTFPVGDRLPGVSVLVQNVPMTLGEEDASLSPATTNTLSEIVGAVRRNAEEFVGSAAILVDYEQWAIGNRGLWKLVYAAMLPVPAVGGSIKTVEVADGILCTNRPCRSV